MSTTEEMQEVEESAGKECSPKSVFCPDKAGWGCIEQVQDCQQLLPKQLLLSYRVWDGGYLQLSG